MGTYRLDRRTRSSQSVSSADSSRQTGRGSKNLRGASYQSGRELLSPERDSDQRGANPDALQVLSNAEHIVKRIGQPHVSTEENHQLVRSARTWVEQLEIQPDISGYGCVRDLREIMAEWDEELQTIGEDAQLANLDLQNMLQKQQQSLQIISNVSDMLHDTAMAVVRNMGGDGDDGGDEGDGGDAGDDDDDGARRA